MHGLIQAFSRTNRILNSVKTFGNIVCFRDLQQEVEDAIALFGDKEASGIVMLKSYDDYYNGYDENDKHIDGYTDLIDKLLSDFPLSQQIVGEQAQKDFIKLFGAILRLKNILTSFDNFDGQEILPPRVFQDYQSIYIDLWHEMATPAKSDKESINDDITFEIELIKQVEINIDYILMLIEKYHKSNCTDKEILTTIDKAIGSSIQLRSKKQLIEQFIKTVNASGNVGEEWRKFICRQKDNDLEEIITTERLKADETKTFIDNSFRDGELKTIGTDIDGILPPMSRFGGNNREVKKQTVIDKLKSFFEKYFGLVQ